MVMAHLARNIGIEEFLSLLTMGHLWVRIAG